MGDNIDMSLDDIIKKTKTTRGRGRGRGATRGNRGRGSGPVRRGGRQNTRSQSAPYSRPQQLPNRWQHDLFDGDANSSRRLSSGGLFTGCKLHISNLDFGVSDSDIKELFGEFGELKKATVNFDSSGRSHGTADVIFAKRKDALNAVKQYNGVALDGRSMKIEVVSSEIPQPTQAFPEGGRRGTSFGRGQGSRGGRGAPRGTRGRGARGGRGRGRGGQANKGKPVSKDDLDAELDAYNGQEDVDMA